MRLRCANIPRIHPWPSVTLPPSVRLRIFFLQCFRNLSSIFIQHWLSPIIYSKLECLCETPSILADQYMFVPTLSPPPRDSLQAPTPHFNGLCPFLIDREVPQWHVMSDVLVTSVSTRLKIEAGFPHYDTLRTNCV